MLPPGRLLYMAPGISPVKLLKHAREFYHEETEQKVRGALRAVGFDLAPVDRPRRPVPRVQIGRRRFYIVPRSEEESLAGEQLDDQRGPLEAMG